MTWTLVRAWKVGARGTSTIAASATKYSFTSRPLTHRTMRRWEADGCASYLCNAGGPLTTSVMGEESPCFTPSMPSVPLERGHAADPSHTPQKLL
jgi:hypothetical protein